MTKKRTDYLNWDTYFMAVAMLSAKVLLTCFVVPCFSRAPSFNSIIGLIPKTLPINATAGDILPPFLSAFKFSGMKQI